MKSIIENLENLVNNTTGLTIIDKRDDGFTYMVAIKRNEETFVVYTTRGIQHYKKESCLLMLQVTEHIPFNFVAATLNGDFVTPYLETLKKEGVQKGREFYGLSVEELPFFQKAS